MSLLPSPQAPTKMKRKLTTKKRRTLIARATTRVRRGKTPTKMRVTRRLSRKQSGLGVAREPRPRYVGDIIGSYASDVSQARIKQQTKKPTKGKGKAS